MTQPAGEIAAAICRTGAAWTSTAPGSPDVPGRFSPGSDRPNDSDRNDDTAPAEVDLLRELEPTAEAVQPGFGDPAKASEQYWSGCWPRAKIRGAAVI